MNLGGGLVIRECPVSYIDPESTRLLDLFWDCHSILSGFGVGILCHAFPEAGGAMDQDNRTMDAFQVIKAEVMKWFEEKQPKGNKGKDGH